MDRSDPRRPSGSWENSGSAEVLTLPAPGDEASTQRPALLLTCSEPVIAQRLLPRLGPRPLYVWRNPGPRLAFPAGPQPDLEPLLEKALRQHGVQEIVVCGHVGCQWLKQFWEGGCLEHGERAHAEALALRQAVRSQARGATPEDIERTLAEQHVASQIAQLQAYPTVAQRLEEGTLRLHAWIYDQRTEAVYGRGPADSPLLAWLRRARATPATWEPVFDPCNVYLA